MKSVSLIALLPSGKTKFCRLSPAGQEGLHIQYQLRFSGKTLAGIGIGLGTSRELVRRVVAGRCHSARVEAEIVRILGKNDWNEVVLEARSAVTGKPVSKLVEEFNRKLQARDAAVLSGLGAVIAKAAAGNARPKPEAAPAGRRAV